MSNPVKEFLISAGYKVSEDGTGNYRTTAHYRDGGNPTSLSVNIKTGAFTDFGTGDAGSFKDLVKLISGLEIDETKLEEYIKKLKEYDFEDIVKKVKVVKKYDKSILETFLPDYNYWLKRGISIETQKLFGIGLCTSGRLYKRYVVPVFERNGDLIGFSGRYYKDDLPENVVKWKHENSSKNFLFPLHLNDEIIKKKKEIVLVESPGDLLSLWELGVKNAICLFGIKASPKVINYICGIYGLKKVWISLNDDSETNGGVGNSAAELLKKKLSLLINPDIIEIKLPPKPCNDWNEYLLKKKLK